MTGPREHSAARGAGRARLVDLALVAWLLVAVAVSAGLVFVMGNRPFDAESQSWLSAHFATMARSFVAEGIGALHGVPIQNNPPLGRQPDAYIHWPPLFPILLSVVYRVFGESEAVTRRFMLALLLLIGAALYALVRGVASRRAAVIAVAGFLLSPAIVEFGWTATHLPLALWFHTLAVLGFLRAVDGGGLRPRWAGLGLLSMALATLSSWEPLLAALGLLVAALLIRSRSGVRLAIAYLGVGVAVVLGLLAAYVRTYPFLFADLWHTVLYRLGLGFGISQELPIHAFVDQAVYGAARPSALETVATVLGRHLKLGGPTLIAMGGVMTCALLARDAAGRRLALLTGGLFAPWLLWMVLMSHHVLYHDYEILIATPFAAACLGIGLAAAIEYLEAAPAGSALRSLSWLAVLAVPAVILGAALDTARVEALRLPPPTGRVEYAIDIAAGTPANAVILSPEVSMVPVYYARRHVIRGITSDASVRRARAALRGVFPGSPVYLALRPDRLEGFSESLRSLPEFRRTSHVILLAVGDS